MTTNLVNIEFAMMNIEHQRYMRLFVMLYSVSTVAENSIPADLILNWDQRGMRMVPVNDWTMTTRCSKRVSVTGLGDKRDTFFSNKCPILNWL